MILILCMETALLYHLPDQKNRQLLDAILVVAGNLNQLRNNPILSYPILSHEYLIIISSHFTEHKDCSPPLNAEGLYPYHCPCPHPVM